MPRTFALVISLFCCTAAAAIDDVPPATPVVPRVQTAASVQDAASDVAIWVHPTDPGRSLVIGAGGTAGLETFRLDGASVQRLPTPQVDLVDVRHGVALQDRTVNRTEESFGVIVDQFRFRTCARNHARSSRLVCPCSCVRFRIALAQYISDRPRDGRGQLDFVKDVAVAFEERRFHCVDDVVDVLVEQRVGAGQVE